MVEEAKTVSYTHLDVYKRQDKDGHGPAWNNSLFEDNAEHGLGMAVGYEAVQHLSLIHIWVRAKRRATSRAPTVSRWTRGPTIPLVPMRPVAI